MSTTTDSIKERQKSIIGNVNGDYWVYDSENGFDLSRPTPPTAGPAAGSITLQTMTLPITIDPVKSALIIIDMQNFFLSTAIGRPAGSKGLKAEAELIRHAIPAARKAGIQIIWVNWGLSEEDLGALPPAEIRAFGFSAISMAEFNRRYSPQAKNADPESNKIELMAQNDLGKDSRIYKGLGHDLGKGVLPDGREVAAGRMLVRNQWNTELSPPLQLSYQSSLSTPKPDVRLDKNRISGLHLESTPTSLYLQAHGIKTLFFAGVNTDQCVNATLTDAFCQGYDCVLLKDASATTSPVGAQECVENNVRRTMGFVVDCESFARDIKAA